MKSGRCLPDVRQHDLPRKHEEKGQENTKHEIRLKFFVISRLRGSFFRAFAARLSELPLGLWTLHGRCRLALRGGLALARLLARLAKPRHLRRLRLERGRVGLLRAKLAEHSRGA